MENQALIIIDMLNDFVLRGAPLEVPTTRKIIPALKKEIAKARKKRVPILYLCDSHRQGDPEFKLWPPHCLKGTPGGRVIDDLAPAPTDYLIPKTTYSGFYKTRLDRTLRQIGASALLVTGCVTNICVLYTVADAVFRGYEVSVIKDCVAGLSAREDRFAFEQMERILHVKVI